MIKVNIVINTKPWRKKINSPEIYFKKKLNKISKVESIFKKKNIIFTVLLTNSLEIKKLNKKFRNKNKPTDVLSFPYFSNKKLKTIKDKNLYIGDIAVAYEIIHSRSQINNFFLEFDKAWIHGFLHLLGYDHIKNKDYIKMAKIEKKIINLIN